MQTSNLHYSSVTSGALDLGARRLPRTMQNIGFFVLPPVLSTYVGSAIISGVGTLEHPNVTFLLIASTIQIVLFVLRNFFSERRDILNAFKNASDEIAAHWSQMMAEQRDNFNDLMKAERRSAQQYRHGMANYISALILENTMLRNGADPRSLPATARPVYTPEIEALTAPPTKLG